MEVRIERYAAEKKDSWDKFVRESKNGFFLFERSYMEYHADRFKDHSLLFYNGDELMCLLPANEKEGVLQSHAGLTFGGFVMGRRASASFLLAALQSLIEYAKSNALHELIYKCIPYIYHRLPAQEDLYALFRHNAVLYRRDISSVIELSVKPSYTKGTKSNLSKARKNNLRVEASGDFSTFMAIEEELLNRKYGTRPTHTTEEITRLAEQFPEHIKLYLVYKEAQCLGGTITYQTTEIVHTQYIGITDEGKEMGALDAVTDYLLQQFQATHKYFSFGTSTVEEGRVLNEGLIRNKESFGARAIVHDFYKMELGK